MQVSIMRAVALTVTSIAVVLPSGEPRAFQAPQEIAYDVADLPGLGGRDSRSNGIKNGAIITGYSNLQGDQARRGMIWFRGHPIALGTFGGPNSSVAWSGQNNSGLVVGIAQTDEPQPRSDGWSCRGFFPAPHHATYTCVGFVWEGGTITPLPTLGGHNGFAASANNRRQVVGWTETTVADSSCINPSDLQFRAVVWDLNANLTRALPLYDGDSASAATAINDRGQVVGISGTCDQSIGRHSARRAVLWENGTVKDLGTLGGDTWNTPTAITQRGDMIVGFANAPGADPDNPMFRAFIWTEREDVCNKLPGTNMCDLGTLDPGGTAQAWGVNEHGQVVGTSCPPTGACKAFLWERGAMKDLNAFKGGYAHHLENAMDINNRGQIGGRSRTTTLERRAFVATPLHQR